MRGSPGPPGAMRSSLPNFANINNIHQCEIHMKPRKRQNFLQVIFGSELRLSSLFSGRLMHETGFIFCIIDVQIIQSIGGMFHHLSEFNLFQAWLNKFPSRAKKIDVLSRVIFPAIFAFFNLAYWTFYLTQEANTDVKSPG